MVNTEELQRLLSPLEEDSESFQLLPRGAREMKESWRLLATERAQRELARRDEYLQAIVAMQSRLLMVRDTEIGALNVVLKPLGEASRVSRVYLFENSLDEQGRLLMSQRAEWCAPGVLPELHNPDLQGLPYEDFFSRWWNVLGAGQPIRGNIATFPEEEREILEPQGIISILVIPIMVDGALQGFVGFDECTNERTWSRLEVDLLSTAANSIGLVVEQRRAERSLRDMNEMLERTRDEACRANMAKSTFLAKVSHELRTPLNAVIGYSELLLEEVKESDGLSLDEAERWGDDLDCVLKSGRHLLLMVNDLLDLSRIEVDGVSLVVARHDANDLIEDVLAMLHHAVEIHDSQFVHDIDPAIGAVWTDAKAMSQILINLLSNAFKYTHEGVVRLNVRADQRVISILIEDTGEGMSEEALGRVFDAFVQADDSYTRAHEGVGLGLAITKRLADALGMTLVIESVLGQGTTVRLDVSRMPATQEDKPLA